MSSEKWMYVGCIVIAVSCILQFIGVYYPVCNVIGLFVNMVSIPFTIFQSKKSAIETSQQIWRNTSEGRVVTNLGSRDSRSPMGK